jgi:quinol monooxygenase YgiN
MGGFAAAPSSTGLDLKAVKADVEANEKGTLQYQVCRGVDNTDEFTIFEEVSSV